MFCPKCGKVLEEDAKFCKFCGNPINGETETNPVQSSPSYNLPAGGYGGMRGKRSGGWAKVVGVVILIGAIGSITAGNGGRGNKETVTSTSGAGSQQTADIKPTATPSPTPTAAPTPTPIYYNAYTIAQLNADLENNAMKASEDHKGEYVAVTGRLYEIDAQGSYIVLDNPNNPFDFKTIHCNVKRNEEVKQQIMSLRKDSIITVRGKITDVGEVLGYSMDIDSVGNDGNEANPGYTQNYSYGTVDSSGYDEVYDDAWGDYILPESHTRYLTEEDLRWLGPENLRLARNEIYARHGRMFKAADLQEYFDGQGWYQPIYTPEEFDAMGESMLNEYERENLKLIQEMESQMR